MMTNTKITTKRQVRITLRHSAYFVEYVDRKPRQRYLAAQFAADMRTREQVEQWVRKQSNLTLESMEAQDSKNYYVLGLSRTTGVLVRCDSKDIAEHELGMMRNSNCYKIARTVRPVTEAEALAWFPVEIKPTKRDAK